MSNKVRRALMGILAVVFCVSAGVFVKSFMEYRKGDKIYEEAKGFVITADTPVQMDDKYGARRYTEIAFSDMQSVNDDVIGWIQIPETVIDYPLLDADDNKYYLNHTYDRQWSSYGSIFIEPRNKPDLSEDHLVVYGHNMVNKSMFGSLLKYKEQEYADQHKYIRICMPDRDLTYQVFSAYTAHVDSATYALSFADETEFDEMKKFMKDNSVITSDADLSGEKQILTLSTCTPEGARKYRFVVNAILIENTEKTA